MNDWYSQCVPGAAATTMKTSTTTAATTASPGPTTSPNPGKGKFKWFGINQSVAEFGKGSYPGVWGEHFRFPENSAMQV